MIVIGDVHGGFDTLIKLIEKLPNDNICFVGDLIDRGPKSAQVVDFVIENNYDCVLGNHEELMIHSEKYLDI
jgi:serine/threonine protein phosphatase 1